MSIWEFNEELYREAIQLDALENGFKQGQQEGLQEGLQQGLQEGLQQGLLRNCVELICRKLAKGKTEGQIQKELEESTEDLRSIIDTAKRYAPEYDVDRIIEELTLKSPEIVCGK